MAFLVASNAYAAFFQPYPPAEGRETQCSYACQEIFKRFWDGGDAVMITGYINELEALIAP